MRKKVFLLFVQGFTSLGGTILVLTSLFALQLGLDNDPGWGKGRIMLFASGCLLLAIFLAVKLRQPLGGLLELWQRAPFYQQIQRRFLRWGQQLAAPATEPEKRSLSGSLAAFAAAGLVIAVYLWYLSAGTWTTWPEGGYYYDRLADGFLSGQLSLPETPSAQLLALANPYDFHSREGVPQLWDATLYQGKYYLYFGPVPALAAALVKTCRPGVLEDQYLLFGFLAVYALAFAGLLLGIRKIFLPGAPPWKLFLGTLLGGLALPILWLANRPSVYETAIAAGQCFLVLGLALGVLALSPGKSRALFLILAGTSWGLAVNSRLSLAVPVIFLALLWSWWLVGVEKNASLPGKVSRLVCLLAPLALAAGGMAWYNFARFSSIFETGHRYQLTGAALPADYRLTTSLVYLVPNAYNYLLRPVLIHLKEFPFIFTPYLSTASWPSFMRLPANFQYAEPVSGILWIFPAAWLALAPLSGLLRRFVAWLNYRSAPAALALANRQKWLAGLCLGGVLAAFAPVLIYIFSTMRYLADVTPLLAMSGFCGWNWTSAQLKDRPYWRLVLDLIATVLILASLAIGLLAVLQSPEQRLLAHNPQLYAQIAKFFSPK